VFQRLPLLPTPPSGIPAHLQAAVMCFMEASGKSVSSLLFASSEAKVTAGALGRVQCHRTPTSDASKIGCISSGPPTKIKQNSVIFLLMTPIRGASSSPPVGRSGYKQGRNRARDVSSRSEGSFKPPAADVHTDHRHLTLVLYYPIPSSDRKTRWYGSLSNKRVGPPGSPRDQCLPDADGPWPACGLPCHPQRWLSPTASFSCTCIKSKDVTKNQGAGNRAVRIGPLRANPRRRWKDSDRLGPS
jgi:hypothetical protein